MNFNKTCFRVIVALLTLMVGSSHMLYAQDEIFNPTPPDEPVVPVFYTYYTVKVQADDALSCNVSSTATGKTKVGTTATINTSAKSPAYTFKHWLKNDEKTNYPQTFTYTVNDEDEDVTFVACYDYQPNTPSEPTLEVVSYLTLQSDPEGACSFNRTSGAAAVVDSWVSLTTVANQDYRFVGWYDEAGKLVSNEVTFNYQMPYKNTTLTAKYIYVFVFNPESPDEPTQSEYQQSVLNQLTGDINKDGVIDTEDAVRLIEAYLDATSETVLGLGIYDYNNDGVVDTEDAVRIIEQYLNSK